MAKAADVVVIGAGLGGLACAARLARAGRRVVVLEKSSHVGGTSHVFRRGPYLFPMGPLSFGFPGRVMAALAASGIAVDVHFRRNHFQLVSPRFDIVYSRPLAELKAELGSLFPAEAAGLEAFFGELTAEGDPDPRLSARTVLERHLGDPALCALLGSMGTEAPSMSMANLRIMWKVMSEEGIWFPSIGIHGLCELLARALVEAEGVIRLSRSVSGILIDDGRAVAVRTEDGEVVRADWIVSNADLKTTVLELIPERHLPPKYRQMAAGVPYTGSEICVYLGLDPDGADFDGMRATHLFYRRRQESGKPRSPADFDEAEIEICRWSDNYPSSAPPGRAVLLLRTGFAYEAVEDWRTGWKTRREGYADFKRNLAGRLIETVEGILPGLGGAVDVMEIATPLTYRDWGGRWRGSIAGWTWSSSAASWPDPLLVRTPIPNVLAAGLYAARELFLGGVPTSIHTAEKAAEIILNSD